MRRAVIRAFRTGSRYPLRKPTTNFGRKELLPFSNYVLGPRSASPTHHGQTRVTLKSSMYFRRLSVVAASAIAGYGAWYAYRNPTVGGVVQRPGEIVTAQSSRDLTYSAINPAPKPIDDEIPAEATRKAVVVTADTIYTGAIGGDEPVSKYTDDSGRKVLEMLTPEQATQKLRRNEESFFVGRGKGVVRYDVVQIPSNDPIEDDHSEKIVEVPSGPTSATPERDSSSDWMFWGVYDGHSGWTTSAKLRQTLINYVARELNSTYRAALKDSSTTSPSSEAIEAAIKTGFNKLDYEIVHESVDKVTKANSKLVAAELLGPALSGACALLSFYDSNSKLLRVACTGDSRAVLGRRGASGKWVATPLSVDQTGSNPDEAARIRKQHPGEESVVAKGRVLGQLEPTRAFGDAPYKWTRKVSERLKASFFGKTPSVLLKTPPYVTAEPVVTTTRIEPENGDFVVMATDGLWEMLTNEEVIGLVGQWIEKQSSENKGNNNSNMANSWLKMFSQQQKGLPVEHEGGASFGDGQRKPVRQAQWGVEGNENQRFVVQDKNVATHLVRNALGGRNTEMVCALLTLPSPYARRYRDDLTVEVIFFGHGQSNTKSGGGSGSGSDVTLNKEASAPHPLGGVKARL